METAVCLASRVFVIRLSVTLTDYVERVNTVRVIDT